MTKVLILGATGNLGGLTAETLSKEYSDVQLRLTSSRSGGCELLRSRFPTAEVCEADWYDPASLAPAVRGVDKVFMVTPDFVTDENLATPNVIRAVREAGTGIQIVRFIAIPPGLTRETLEPEFLATRAGANLHVIAKPLLDASGLPMTYINAPCWIMFNLPWFLAEEVKRSRRLAMPAITDAPRLWLAESDIAAVAAKVLASDGAEHVGKEHILTGTERLNFAQVADLLSDVLGERVVYADDDRPLRAAMGNDFDTLMTYFRHETQAYSHVPISDTVERLLGRPQVELRGYLEANKHLFV